MSQNQNLNEFSKYVHFVNNYYRDAVELYAIPLKIFIRNSIHIARNKIPTKNNTENEEPNEDEMKMIKPANSKTQGFLSVDNCTGYLYYVATTSIGQFEKEQISNSKMTRNNDKRELKPQNKHRTSGDSSPQSSGANLVPTKPSASAR